MSDADAPGPDDLRDAFMVHPTPLALLDAAGRPRLCNASFVKRFGTGGIAPSILEALARDPQPGVASRDAVPGLRLRTQRTAHGLLLIVDEPAVAAVFEVPPGLIDALQARVRQLESLVATDHLTGAWNRAHLDAVLAQEVARHGGARQPLSLILMDIDHFKHVNDTYGHAVGDVVLKELVALVKAHSRASDLLFRWGGEEFVLLVTAAGYRRAEIIAGKLREVIATHSFGPLGTVTVSLGVAEHDGDEDAITWFRRLDAALYEAKRTGRNRVVVARRGDSDAWAAEGGAGALNLVWQEGYESGDPTIDAEHREIFRLANALIHAAAGERGDKGPIWSALDEVIDHVRAHFAAEEAILERLGYPHLPEHRRVHAGLLKRALQLRTRVRAGEAKLGAVVEFLALDVVMRHLTAADRAFFPLLAPR